MQDRPTAAEFLDAIAELLEGPVLDATSGPLKHQVRVAGNLCRILEREARGGVAAEARQVALIAEVLDVDPKEHDAEALHAMLAERLKTADDVALERRAWPALVEIVRGKLAISKPGHDAYDFAGEQADAGVKA